MSALDITAGVFYDMPEEQYHAHPALSSTDARRLNDCPARFKWFKDGRTEYKAEFDFGHAAHKLVLGVGADVDVIEADDWRTKDAKAQRDESRTAGRIPILRDDWDRANAMADAIRQHPIAGRLLDPDRGRPEASLVWPDGDVWRRARFDFLPEPKAGQRLVLVDYKTAKSADPRKFAKSAADYGYHQQDPWYRDAAVALLGVEDPAFVFVVQEVQPPCIVTVCELDPYDVRGGRVLNRQAIETYRACRDAGRWPGYSDEVELIELPPWQRKTWEELEEGSW